MAGAAAADYRTGESVTQKYGRPRAVLAYVLTSAALVTALVTGPAVMLTGTAAQAGTTAAHPVPAVNCGWKIHCGDECCVLA
jgi:hypothetical protein